MTQTAQTDTPVEKVKGALLRYRVLAWVTGVWLLLLVAEVVLKIISGGWDSWNTGIHVLDHDNSLISSLSFVPIVHGWVYFAYLIFTVDLAIKVRWPIGKIVLTAIAGTIPFLSFYVEHLRTKELKEQYGLGGDTL